MKLYGKRILVICLTDCVAVLVCIVFIVQTLLGGI